MCGPAQPGVGAPEIISFSVSPSSVNAGDSVRLFWEVSDAIGVRLYEDGDEWKPDPQHMDFSEWPLIMPGHIGTSPNSTTTYKLMAYNREGKTERTFTVQVAGYQAEFLIPLHSWYSPSRGDNFATTNPAWAGKPGDKKSPDYRFVRLEGRVYSPDQPQPTGMIPLYSWYSPSRGDNFVTTNPAWAGRRGDKRPPDYRFVRLEGFIPTRQVSGTNSLQSFFNAQREDNFATTNPRWRGKKVGEKRANGTYRLFRMEGYVWAP